MKKYLMINITLALLATSCGGELQLDEELTAGFANQDKNFNVPDGFNWATMSNDELNIIVPPDGLNNNERSVVKFFTLGGELIMSAVTKTDGSLSTNLQIPQASDAVDIKVINSQGEQDITLYRSQFSDEIIVSN